MMQILNSDETVAVPSDNQDCSTAPTENIEEELEEENSNIESAIDASGKTLDLQLFDEKRISDGDNASIEGLYVYKNMFNLIPRSVGGLVKLKTLKFFGNEVNLFPSEFGNLVNLERLQVKISLPGLTGLPLQKLKALKELELSKAPPRPSAFPLLADIMGLECLTKLSVCHFSIRYLPPEIGCLTCLEYLDLSHNKMRNLPTEITNLSSLITLKVANNKLIQVPSALSSLQRLESLDLSNNRLTSLGSLELDTMHNLRRLNLQCNKLLSFPQIPLWISCVLEGNDEDMTNGEFMSSSVEMDVFETAVTDLHGDIINGSPASLSSHVTGCSSNRCFAARKPRKGWKRRYYLQQRARQERLNCSRKWKGEDSAHITTQNATANCESCNAIVPSESLVEGSSVNVGDDEDNKELLAADGESGNSLGAFRKDISSEQVDAHSCGCVALQSVDSKEIEDDCSKDDDALGSPTEIYGSTKDAGDILLDKLQIASLLALFVSDHFGGSDRSTMVDRARKSVSGSNYNKPFVCTCPTGNNDNIMKSAKQSLNSAEDAVLLSLCEKSLRLVKARRNSIVVPIGTLQFGVCRHRALLMKYLCDRMEPQVPCELVRGYLDFAPHAWNVVVVKRGDSEVRMVVDACRPHDIREEMDPEYFYRYIPLSRINGPPITDASPDVHNSFPSLSACEEIEEGGLTTLIQCNLGSVEAVAKVRTLEVSESSADEIKNFEFNCLGEVRLLSVLKHPCIVKILGHQISTKWLPSQDGIPKHRILQSAIFMEHVKGGSLKLYIEKLARSGEKHVPVELALQIARDVAWALSELHSKDIMHRDLKSGNIVIDLDEKSDGAPVVKLCDFDRAVPLRSSLHTCCIGHVGIPPPDVCVGTPRWMAPEVYRTIHDRRLYGLEVDLWSFGCLLLELLTLQVPYVGLPESQIHDLLLMGKRPVLTDELEGLGPAEDSEEVQQNAEYKKNKKLRFLIDIYRQCTKEDPSDRPTANEVYQMLVDFDK
ncbi:Armadillo repeat-containing protein 3 and Serine/threonine-protein kinase CTR1 [Cynara cardunculus var. scolymus]|uniref:Armadillo repeat-containing protein 3 and Serine/threonine-protein kinase CTR1 n=1 Tax=Cynara cardunculus var. scolymus TaxID=59895 RepID=A0A103XMT9_CYNCS|nr:Armadillo repeat-containing protein 3 and Serine/threonine-protein kinase CTR1 [Cynara cardunculus var. scolymus]